MKNPNVTHKLNNQARRNAEVLVRASAGAFSRRLYVEASNLAICERRRELERSATDKCYGSQTTRKTNKSNEE